MDLSGDLQIQNGLPSSTHYTYKSIRDLLGSRDNLDPMEMSKSCHVFRYVTRLITSLCRGCSESLMNNHPYTVQSLHFTIQLLLMAGSRLSSTATIPRLSFECNPPLIYLRPLLLNEPFLITVDTPVRITTELLSLPRQRSPAFP
jgi:hypothetical protein